VTGEDFEASEKRIRLNIKKCWDGLAALERLDASRDEFLDEIHKAQERFSESKRRDGCVRAFVSKLRENLGLNAR
jgi:hypothetical protein